MAVDLDKCVECGSKIENSIAVNHDCFFTDEKYRRCLYGEKRCLGENSLNLCVYVAHVLGLTKLNRQVNR